MNFIITNIIRNFSIIFFPNLITCFILNMIGDRIGRYVYIGFNLIVCKKLIMDNDSVINHLNLIYTKQTLSLKYGSIISHLNIIYGKNSLFLGKLNFIGIKNVFDLSKDIIFGDYSVTGQNVMLFTHKRNRSFLHDFNVAFGNIVLGNNVTLLANSFVGPNVKILNDITFLPNSTVIKNFSKKGIYTSDGINSTSFNYYLTKKKINFRKKIIEIKKKLETNFNCKSYYLSKNSINFYIQLNGIFNRKFLFVFEKTHVKNFSNYENIFFLRDNIYIKKKNRLSKKILKFLAYNYGCRLYYLNKK